MLFALGIWACEVTGRALGAADHGGMVWDETVAFLLVLFFVPATLPWQAAAFLLFRLFDILKPPPIRYYDRTLQERLRRDARRSDRGVLHAAGARGGQELLDRLSDE